MRDEEKSKEQLIEELAEMRRQGEYFQEALGRLTAILEVLGDLVAVMGLQGYIFYLNKAGRRMLGVGEDEDVSKVRLSDCQPGWAQALITKEAMPILLQEGIWSGETAFLSRDGREIPTSQVILAHKTCSGAPQLLSTIARDLSERKRLETQLVHLVDYDALTGLLTHSRFQEELQRQLAQVRRYNVHGALLYLDLDRFKEVNDKFNPQVGDELLKSLADLLRKQLRETDFVARVGGDEFIILLPYTDIYQAQMVARRLLVAIRRHNIGVDEHSVGSTVSIGITAFPERTTSVKELIAQAESAMQQAKKNGGNRFRVHVPDRKV